MKTYRTAQVAARIGIHPNTVRLYEAWGLIPKPERLDNGYRVFTDLHIRQMQLARTAFQVEVLQNGLRAKIIEVVKTSARGEYDEAMTLTEEYLHQLKQERNNAEEAIQIAERILSGGEGHGGEVHGGEVHDSEAHAPISMRRREVSEHLGISMDTLRSWEMNGLLTVKRKQNGYRVYTDDDIKRLKIIRSLRCANYSLQAILRLLGHLSEDPEADLRSVLNTLDPKDDIISVCDNLIASLGAAEKNARQILDILFEMKTQFS